MNQEEKAKRYDWLLNEYKGVEQQINMVPKIPLDETLHSLDSREYTAINQNKVNVLKQKLTRIDEEVKRLF